ncbi:universal stress protein [Streptomyces sp. NPDC014733]|uniref:universal stress protein n=1 Tax=Streptomyces sp. NPDC014733 TaxID=3364885 RepID=UPI0037019512
MELPVVVGVDGSDASLTAVDWAVDEAVRHGRPLRLVHASLWERYEGVAPDPAADRPAEQVLAEQITAAAAERAGQRAPGLAVTADVAATDAATALLDAAQEAVLLVVGDRGRGAVAGLLLGSVSLLVAARAHCPVVVVRGDRQALDGEHGRVLLGIGDHDVDSPAVRFAFRAAAVRDAELDVVRTWRRPLHEPADHPLLAGEPGTYHAQRAGELLDEALAAAVRDHPGVRLRRSTPEGTARRTMTARSAAADLLVLGARRHGGVFGREFGGVVHRALHHAACPVAVVPQRRPATAEAPEEEEP